MHGPVQVQALQKALLRMLRREQALYPAALCALADLVEVSACTFPLLAACCKRMGTH